jgi:DnaJ-class molecular chaperone
VDIPAGTLDGFRFTFKGESDWLEGYGGVGDLVFVIVIDYEAGSNIFKREGVHLVVNKQISLVDSLCGVNFGIKHMDNRIIQVTHAGILKTGDSLVANGEGMPVLKENRQDGRYVATGQRGNMIIRFTVVYPSTISDKQREALRKVIKSNDPQINQPTYMNVNVDGLREQAVQDPQILEMFKIVTPTLVAESVPDFSQQQHNRQHARAAGPAGGFPNGFMHGMSGEMPQGVQCAHQ